MTSTPAPEPTGNPTDGHAAERRVLRTALRDTTIFLAVLAIVGVGVGALAAGVPGVWGALVGVAIAGFFCATTVWSMLRSVGATPAAMAGLVMGTWIAKIVVLMGVLAVLRGRDFYDPWVLLVVVAVGAIGSSLLDYRAVQKGQLPYVGPS